MRSLESLRQVAEFAETVEVIIPHLVGSKTGGICCYSTQSGSTHLPLSPGSEGPPAITHSLHPTRNTFVSIFCEGPRVPTGLLRLFCSPLLARIKNRPENSSPGAGCFSPRGGACGPVGTGNSAPRTRVWGRSGVGNGRSPRFVRPEREPGAQNYALYGFRIQSSLLLSAARPNSNCRRGLCEQTRISNNTGWRGPRTMAWTATLVRLVIGDHATWDRKSL